MATILITGGSGLIGTRLTQLLLEQGDEVQHLSRSKRTDAPVPVYTWNIERGEVDPQALQGVDHIIHLSGASIAGGRWTAARMRVLYDSRVKAAEVLLAAAERVGRFPDSFISASGINYYGAVTSEHIFSEEDAPAHDAIGKLTQAWEHAADRWASYCRVVKLRTPMVLAREGGAWPTLSATARRGLAAPIGSGKQWITWLHLHDIARAYAHAMAHANMHGAYNVAAPEQVTHRDFTRQMAKALHKPACLPAVPAVFLRLALGRLSDLLLNGSRASNERLLDTGFRFMYPGLGVALRELAQ